VEGFLIYLKPSLATDEESDLLSHFRHCKSFPHDPTRDQLYDEDTVDSWGQPGGVRALSERVFTIPKR
jgi:hypothetical protein